MNKLDNLKWHVTIIERNRLSLSLDFNSLRISGALRSILRAVCPITGIIIALGLFCGTSYFPWRGGQQWTSAIIGERSEPIYLFISNG